MEGGDVQNIPWHCFPPLYNQPLPSQPAHYSVIPLPHCQWEQWYRPLAVGPTVLLPWHFSGASVQATLTPGVSDANPGDEPEFGGGPVFADDEFWAHGPRPDRHITAQEDPSRGTNFPYNQGNWNQVQLYSSTPFYTAPDSQSSHVPPPQLQYMPGTHPKKSAFERHPDQSVEAPESSGFRRFPATTTAQGSRIRLTDSKEWLCNHDGCNKSYRRQQELIRHLREGHGSLPAKCLICDVTWKRPEKLRKHLIDDHGDYFTEKERQRIHQLRGMNNTINFLMEWKLRGSREVTSHQLNAGPYCGMLVGSVG